MRLTSVCSCRLFNLGETTFSSDCSDVQQAASQHLSSSSDDSTANTSCASGHDSAVDAVLSERLEEAPKQEEDGREGWRSDELRAMMEHMEAVLSATEDAMVTTKSKVETLLELMRQSEEQVEELRELKQELLVLQGLVESLGAEKRVLEWRLKAELREKRKNEEQEEHVAMMMKKTLEQLEDAHRQIVEELDSSKSALEEELKRTVESERRLREEKELLESRLKVRVEAAAAERTGMTRAGRRREGRSTSSRSRSRTGGRRKRCRREVRRTR